MVLSGHENLAVPFSLSFCYVTSDSVVLFSFTSRASRQAIKEIYSQDAARAKAAAAERKKNGTIEMSAAKMAAMMDEAGGGEAGGDVPMVKVRSMPSI